LDYVILEKDWEPRLFCSALVLPDGIFLGAWDIVFSSVSDAEQLEALACREALALVADLDLQLFKVSTDCLHVVKNIHGVGIGSYDQIIKEIKARMEDFTLVDIVQKVQESNVDAHILECHHIYESIGRHVWLLTLCEKLTLTSIDRHWERAKHPLPIKCYK
jgi:hypothetical protein